MNEKFSKITQDYKLFYPPIGEGSFGEVRKGTHNVTGQEVAIKIIHKKKQSKSQQ